MRYTRSVKREIPYYEGIQNKSRIISRKLRQKTGQFSIWMHSFLSYMPSRV